MVTLGEKDITLGLGNHFAISLCSKLDFSSHDPKIDRDHLPAMGSPYNFHTVSTGEKDYTLESGNHCLYRWKT
jgi:hypothetical protein